MPGAQGQSPVINYVGPTAGPFPLGALLPLPPLPYSLTHPEPWHCLLYLLFQSAWGGGEGSQQDTRPEKVREHQRLLCLPDGPRPLGWEEGITSQGEGGWMERGRHRSGEALQGSPGNKVGKACEVESWRFLSGTRKPGTPAQKLVPSAQGRPGGAAEEEKKLPWPSAVGKQTHWLGGWPGWGLP